MPVQLVSLNIEEQKHLPLVSAFLARQQADVVCLMEVYDVDVAELGGSVYPYTVYAPNNVVREASEDQPRITLGVAILSKTPITNWDIFYADGKDATTISVRGLGTHSPVVIMAQIGSYTIGTTHFTWTEGGSVSEEQRTHVAALIPYLESRKPFILCGDFNIPRGNEIYHVLAQHYSDNIPASIMTTLDPVLHRANKDEPGKLKYVVDYVWSTPEYLVNDVQIVAGVSDHCAVVATIT